MNTILWISGILGFLANIPYIVSIIIKRNSENPMKPSRVSWIIWAILDIMIISTSITNGKDWIEIALPLGYALGATVVAILSLFYGEWGNLKEAIVVAIGSLIGILLWIFAGSELALYAFVSVLWMSAFPTIKKIWIDPLSESRGPWLIWLIAATLSAIALGLPSDWTLVGSIVSVTYLLMNIPIVYSLYFRRV